MAQYKLHFTRKSGADYVYIFDASELKRARRMLHLLNLFGIKDATLNPHRKR